MELRNHAPFTPLAFQSRDKHDRVHDVVVVKGTYDLEPGRRPRISERQEPLTISERYYGAPNTTSLVRAGDLAAFKPRADVAIIAEAHAPRGAPSSSWLAEVRIGALRKILRVHGPRAWRRSMGMFWELEDAEPCTRVPIRYELAFGGAFEHGDEPRVCERNPIGVGYAPGPIPRDVVRWPAPRIEDAADPITELGREHAPAGLGFVSRSWQPRLALAGTFDERWKREKWPLPPDDWDDAFNNAAHPDLVVPYLRGGEPFHAIALSASAIEFPVPHEKIDVRFRYRDGRIETHPTNLDTFTVDLVQGKLLLTYRARVPEAGPVRVLEILMRSE